jgi:hypothetical protein
MKPIRWIILLGVVVLLLPWNASAADFDGSKPLICALMGNFECDSDGCQRVTAEGINLPQFLRLDFKEKKVTTIREGNQVRTTRIERLDRLVGSLFLQGLENGLAWSLVISETDGKMTLTMTGDQVGFMVFGACTAP